MDFPPSLQRTWHKGVFRREMYWRRIVSITRSQEEIVGKFWLSKICDLVDLNQVRPYELYKRTLLGELEKEAIEGMYKASLDDMSRNERISFANNLMCIDNPDDIEWR